MDQISRGQKIGIVFISGLMLCIFAFYNKFPLFFPDTASYVSAGFKGQVPFSRPIYYGLFIRHVSLNETLWLVVIAQGILLALLIMYSFKYLFHKKISAQLYLVYMLLISTTTAISVHVSMLMPDVFTPMVILAFLLLVFGKNMLRRDQVIISILLLFSIGTHNVHVAITLGGALFLSIGAINKNIRDFYKEIGLSLKRMLLLWGIIIASNLTLSTVHYAYGGGFESGKGGSVFILARLIDMDILADYLHNYCGENDYPLCPHIKKLKSGASFLWSKKVSPFYKIGGWDEENQKECKRLVKDILTTPKYFKRYLIRCVEDSFLQLLNYSLNSQTVPDKRGAEMSGSLYKHFPFYRRAYWISRQKNDILVGDFWPIPNFLQHLILAISTGLLFFLFFDEKYPKRQKLITFILLVLIYGNAFISVAASGIYDRYQSRVIWLITLPAFWYAWSLFLNRKPIQDTEDSIV
jgi:hypothetical protein